MRWSLYRRNTNLLSGGNRRRGRRQGLCDFFCSGRRRELRCGERRARSRIGSQAHEQNQRLAQIGQTEERGFVFFEEERVAEKRLLPLSVRRPERGSIV